MARKRSATIGDVIDGLDRLAKAAGDLSPAWITLGRKYQEHSESIFASEGRGKWNSFASSTLLMHESPLVREGIMRDGMTLPKPRYYDPLMAAYGPPKQYQRRVQNVAILNTVGHADRSGKMVPPRPVKQMLSAGERDQWVEEIRKHIRRAMP